MDQTNENVQVQRADFLVQHMRVHLGELSESISIVHLGQVIGFQPSLLLPGGGSRLAGVENSIRCEVPKVEKERAFDEFFVLVLLHVVQPEDRSNLRFENVAVRFEGRPHMLVQAGLLVVVDGETFHARNGLVCWIRLVDRRFIRFVNLDLRRGLIEHRRRRRRVRLVLHATTELAAALVRERHVHLHGDVLGLAHDAVQPAVDVLELVRVAVLT